MIGRVVDVVHVDLTRHLERLLDQPWQVNVEHFVDERHCSD